MDAQYYDSNTTRLFKKAGEYRIPSIYVVVERNKDELRFSNPIPAIVAKMAQGVSLIAIYNEYSHLNERIDIDFIIYLYITVVGGKASLDYILQVIIAFEKESRKNGINRFIRTDDIEHFNKSFSDLYQEYLREDQEHLDYINRIQGMLVESSEGLPVYSPVESYGSTVLFKPTYKPTQKYPEAVDGIDIFNESQATKYVPYIQYNNQAGDRYYKLLKGDINYNLIGLAHQQTKNSKVNTVYATVWLDNADDHVARAKHDELYDSNALIGSPSGSYYRLVYNLDDGIMSINMPNKTKSNQVTEINEVIGRILVSFPILAIVDIKEVKIRGYFDMYNVDIDEMSFLHMIFDTDIFYSYLYTEEKLRPFAFKHRLDIHYHGILNEVGTQVSVLNENGDRSPLETPGISLTLQLKRVMDEAKVVKYVTSQGTEAEGSVPVGIPWVHFIINGPTNPLLIEECIRVLRVLMKIYMENKETLMDIYRASFKAEDLMAYNMRHYTKTDIKFRKLQREGIQKVKLLKEKDPELFVKDYASVCQSPAQPGIIEDKDVERWKKETFHFKGQIYNRQVMPFPRDNPKWNIVCTSDSRPFVGVKKNTKLSNKDKYPYIPCCFRRDHMDPAAESYYNEYYHNKEVEPKAVVKAKILNRTNKIRPYGFVSILPPTIESALSYYREEDLPGEITDWKIVRAGVVRSRNSLLHCVAFAVNDPGYEGFDEYLENHVLGIRRRLSTGKFPELMRQELYDKTNDQITEMLADPHRYFDPDLFYRAVEDFYQVNIYVYSLEKEEGLVVIPRCKLFHARPMRLNRPTVLILSHWGSESDALEYPQCELIVDYNQATGNIVKLFGANMTTICHNIMTGVSSSITWLQHVTSPVDVTRPARPVFPHLNLYNAIDYAELLGIGQNEKGESTLYSQYIDPNGKARAFTVKIKDEKVTFVVPPSMPENGRHSDTLYRPKAEFVLNIMRTSKAVSRSIDQHGRTTGIWFQALEIDEGVYVPVYKSKNIPPEYAQLPLGPICPIGMTSENSNTQRYYRINRHFKLLNELIEWLFEVYRREVGNVNINVEEFTQSVLVLKPQDVIDSSTFYNFDGLQRILPDVDNLDEGLEYMKRFIRPSEDGRIVVYSDRLYMGLRDKIQVYHEQTLGETPMVAKTVGTYFLTTTDFKEFPNNIIMIGETELDKWKSDRNLKRERIFQIRKTLNLAISVTTDPYLYSGPDGDMWIIQNPSGGSINSALAIAKNWHDSRVNTGPHTPPLKEQEFPVHYIYIIATSGHLGAYQDNTEGGSPYVHIVKYGENNYGALLPLI